MKKNIIIAVMVGACLVSESSAMAQEMLKLKAKDNQEFELEKDHALLSETINDAYEDLADQEGKLKEAIPLGNVTQGEVADLLSGQNYEYILRIYRAYNEGKDADPVMVRGLSAEERKIIGKTEARALDPVIFSANSLKEAWSYLQAAHYLNIPELIEKYARILRSMLCSDASMGLLQANNQEHIKMIGEINKNRTLTDIISHDIHKIWVIEYRLGHTDLVRSASFSPDGSRIVTASEDRTAKIWNARTGALEHTLADHTGIVSSASFSPDNRKVVTASWDGTAKIWDAVTGILEHTLEGHDHLVKAASFSPDVSKIVTASWDKTAKIWNVQTGVCEHTLTGHTSVVESASFSPDGSKIVTASNDGTAKIWNAQTGVCEHTLSHTGQIKSASFSPDGNEIVTASEDGTTSIWNVRTGALERTLEGHAGVGNSALASPDGRKMIVRTSKDKTVALMVLLPADTIEQALFLQYLQFIKNQGGQPGWVSGWGRAIMDTFGPEEKALIEKRFPRTMMQKMGSYFGFGSSSSSNNNNN